MPGRLLSLENRWRAAFMPFRDPIQPKLIESSCADRRSTTTRTPYNCLLYR
jgi:hypothetical protein